MGRSFVFAIYLAGSIAFTAESHKAAAGDRFESETPVSNGSVPGNLAPSKISRDEASAVSDNIFDCSGTILHQSYKGQLASSLAFWFAINEDQSVTGMVTQIGAPLSLPEEALSGTMLSHHDHRGQFIGGKLMLAWPYANVGRPVELGLMRETFIKVGPRYNGVGRVIRRTSNHTYAAGTLRFDPASHPALQSFHRVSFVSATCFPEKGLPNPPASG